MTFDGEELYPNLFEKSAAIANYPFVDGNKRTRHAATETFVVFNGWKLMPVPKLRRIDLVNKLQNAVA